MQREVARCRCMRSESGVVSKAEHGLVVQRWECQRQRPLHTMLCRQESSRRWVIITSPTAAPVTKNHHNNHLRKNRNKEVTERNKRQREQKERLAGGKTPSGPEGTEPKRTVNARQGVNGSHDAILLQPGMGIGKSGWGVLTRLGQGPGAAQALVGLRGNAPFLGD